MSWVGALHRDNLIAPFPLGQSCPRKIAKTKTKTKSYLLYHLQISNNIFFTRTNFINGLPLEKTKLGQKKTFTTTKHDLLSMHSMSKRFCILWFGFKQPLVGEKRCVTTLITAAEETTVISTTRGSCVLKAHAVGC